MLTRTLWPLPGCLPFCLPFCLPALEYRYGENINKGVWMWEDVPELVRDLFPQGLAAVHTQLLAQRQGLPVWFKARKRLVCAILNWKTNICQDRLGTDT
eukprot:COSAG06_NODE_31_length_31488_cov_60.882793_15_plen_99_part_00